MAYRITRRLSWPRIAVFVAAAGALACSVVVYSIADAILFRALPFKDADRIVVVGASEGRRTVYSVGEFADLRRRRSMFSELGASTVGPLAYLDGGDTREVVRAWQISSNLCQVFQITAVAGTIPSVQPTTQ